MVLDTNVLIAAYIARSGGCGVLYEHVTTSHTVVSSEPLLAEFLDRLVHLSTLTFPLELANIATDVVRQRVVLVKPNLLQYQVCRDSDDDVVLASALTGECACIITMDTDLLIIEKINNLVILHPRDFWAFEEDAP